MSRLIPTYIEQGLRIEQLERELAEAKRNYMDFDEGYAEGFSRYLERELAKAIAKERERCAWICDEFYSVEGIAQKCAAAIRKGE